MFLLTVLCWRSNYPIHQIVVDKQFLSRVTVDVFSGSLREGNDDILARTFGCTIASLWICMLVNFFSTQIWNHKIVVSLIRIVLGLKQLLQRITPFCLLPIKYLQYCTFIIYYYGQAVRIWKKNSWDRIWSELISWPGEIEYSQWR